MLATLSSRCSSKRFYDSGREQWLQQQLALCAIPYVRLANQRISRARQTMDKGGPDAREATPSLTTLGLSTRRKSCPLRLLAEAPDQLIRPASACGFYQDPPMPLSPDEEQQVPVTTPTRTNPPTGHAFRSLRKNSKSEDTQRSSSQPKIPAVMKHYARGVVPEGATEQQASPEKRPASRTSLFQD